MAKISKPDANPILAAILTLFIVGLGNLIPNGQKDKFIKHIILWIIGFILCCLPATLVGILGCIDSFKTAVKLKAGKEVDENEYSFKPYYSIAKIVNKKAIFVE